MTIQKKYDKKLKKLEDSKLVQEEKDERIKNFKDAQEVI